MERGLMWLPLLILFFWLGWAGWNEYQKVEAYRLWAASFERAKYDILAVLGQQGAQLTWGKPTRQGPVALQSLGRAQIREVQVWVDGRAIALSPPSEVPAVAQGDAVFPKGKVAIALQLVDDGRSPIEIPFTDAEIACQWGAFLKKWLQES